MANFVYDTFTGANGDYLVEHIGETGATWVQVGLGNFEIYNNRLYFATTSNVIAYASGVAGSDGEYVEANLHVFSSSGSNIGFGVRTNAASDGSGYFILYFEGAWLLFRRNSGTFTQLQSATASLSAGSHTVRITTSGTGASVTVGVLVDGVAPFADYVDSSGSRITSFGGAAVYGSGSATSTTGIHVDTLTGVDGGGGGGGATPATGTLSWTEASDTAALAASVAGAPASATIAWTEASDTAALSGTVTAAGTATIATPVLKNNTGTVLANETGVIVNVYHATTGALVVQKTGLTSNASGIVLVNDALIVAGTSYAYEVVLTGDRRRLPVAVAA